MSNEEILEIIIDFGNALESVAVSMKEQVTSIVQVKEKGEFLENPYDRLVWTNGQGAKGSYQMTSARDNGNNSLYRHFEAILKRNKGARADFSRLLQGRNKE